MELGDLLDLCGNEMRELDCNNSPYDSTFDELADSDNSQENVLHGDGDIQINDSATANFVVQNNLFQSVFTYEEHLMICFGQVCVDVNVPLYLVDELVKILTEECKHGL